MYFSQWLLHCFGVLVVNKSTNQHLFCI